MCGRGAAVILASLLVASGGQTFSDAKSVRVQVRLRGPSLSTATPEVAIVIRPASAPDEPATLPRRIDVPSSREIEVPLEPGAWRLRAEAKGFWGAEAVVEAGEDQAPVVLTLWATGTLSGTVSSTSVKSRPRELWVTFQPAPEDDSGLPPGEVSCPVTRGAWACELPAGKLDFRLGVKGFVPHYRWDVFVRPREALRLGQLTLAPGASLSGFMRPSPRVVFSGCRVELTGLDGRPILVPERERKPRQDPVYRSTPDGRGFFQIGPIPPGEYRMVATCDRRRSIAGAAAVVKPGSESRLPDFLTLAEPAALDVSIAPPRDPWGGEWLVEVEPLLDELGLDRLRKACAKGRAGLEGLSAGDYWITVMSSRGEKWLGQEIRIEEGSGPLALELALVKVEGTVKLGTQPLAASLSFGGIYGAVSIPFRSDESGRFTGFLPKAGAWEVDVTADDPPVTRRFRGVDVQASEAAGHASVEIVLEDAKVTGEVVDEDGRPLARALVRLIPAQPGRAESEIVRSTDAMGRFECRGLPKGKLLLTAETSEASVPQPVEVLLSDEPLEVRLVARKTLELHGRLLSAEGGAPLAGGRVEARPRVGFFIYPLHTRTDAEGRFRLQGVPADVEQLQITAGAPGHVLRTFPVSVPTDRLLTLVLEKGGGGSLVFELPKDWNLRDPNGPNLFLVHSGAAWSLNSLGADWAPLQGVLNSHPRRTVVPQMPAGEYEACQTTTSLALLAIRPAGPCLTGTLQPGGELTFAIRPQS